MSSLTHCTSIPPSLRAPPALNHGGNPAGGIPWWISFGFPNIFDHHVESDCPKIKSCEHIDSWFWDESHSVILGRSSNSWPYTSKAFLERVVGRAHSERTTPGWLLSRFSPREMSSHVLCPFHLVSFLFLSCRSSLYTLDMNVLLIHLLKVVHVLRPEEFVKIQGRRKMDEFCMGWVWNA